MKTLFKILVTLFFVLQLNIAMANENITGTWQGTLVPAPGTEIEIQFIISQADDGTYTVVLDSPEQGGIKNIEANEVAYDAGVLKLDVAELSGSYEGTVKDGKIDGEWHQEGTAIPLALSPYEKPTLSREDMDKLMGAWHGKATLPEGTQGNLMMPVFVFRFEMTDKGEFAGSLEFPEYGQNMPISDMGMSNGSFVCTLPSMMNMKFKGILGENEIVGTLKDASGPNLNLTMKRGEYEVPVISLNLPAETQEILTGEWYGDLDTEAIRFTFEDSESGDFVGFISQFIGSPNQESKGMSITEAKLTDGNLTLIASSVNIEFTGKLSGDELVGEFKQMMNTQPLSLKKGAYVPKVYKLSLSEEEMQLLSGKWQGKLGAMTVEFRFETSKAGDFVAFFDVPDSGATGIPITEAALADGKLTFKVAGAEYIGQLSGDELTGEWKEGQETMPLSLTKE